MRVSGWPACAAAPFFATASLAIAAPVDDYSVAGPAGPMRSAVPFNPPLDQNLPLTITDRRLIPGGGEVVFVIANRLRFTRGEGGMIATLRRDSVDCSGSEPVCVTYRRAMAGWVGTIQRFAIGRDGEISALVESDLSAVGEGVPSAQAALSYVESQQPGSLGMAELREALRYVGQPLDANSLGTLSAHPPEEIAVHLLPDQQADVVYRTRIQLESDPSIVIVRDRRDRVDLATGLVIESAVTSRDGVSPASRDTPPFSDRRWQLTR